ncbi:prenylcysteine oxidase / farnesylcysteine lyase [Geosmithia morbida]|uniref:Prenylcysteine oxidase / farnesylcysteine lyase n=1 Tax=Geosmithia morbida TaxID=1094350 RepID=A0A9P4Z2D3_9HYPO|nr:prenylcysteine oxidase / farnesylcysteine lyase [Geosmithia morbida]KAF4126157.1 prenylcysteine oxidase / farnesylcysteine lyase [Geosmithia morbida]
MVAVTSRSIIGFLALGIWGCEATVRNVAIIGAGAAGSSTAYHLQRFAEELSPDVDFNITIFEKTGRIGGRTLTVGVYDDDRQPVELGASIFAGVNAILVNATRNFDLELTGLRDGDPGDVTAIWDGKRIVYDTKEGDSFWWDAARLWWRYGMSPYRASGLVKRVVDQFLSLYEEPWFPFRSLTQRAYELELSKLTGVTGAQLLEQNGITEQFGREILQAATRVNYASNLAHLHGVDTAVSLAAEGASAVEGGNWRIFDGMVRRSGAALRLNTTVTAIDVDVDADGGGEPGRDGKRYTITTTDSEGRYPVSFDKVVLASPWQFSRIRADENVLRHKIDAVNYTKLHVTLLTTPFRLRPGFFGLEPGSKAPSNVYTTLPVDEEPRLGNAAGSPGFFSVSTLRPVTDPRSGRREFLYKIFSPEPVEPTFLSDIFGVHVDEVKGKGDGGPISWYYPTSFYAYPTALPRVTFQDPVVGDGVFYTSGMEGFISTMETNALMGMNVARLMVDEVRGNFVKEYNDEL